MKLFVKTLSFNENNFPDVFLFDCENRYNNEKYFCVETDLFKMSSKYFIGLNCREVNLEEEILNIKYLKVTLNKNK